MLDGPTEQMQMSPHSFSFNHSVVRKKPIIKSTGRCVLLQPFLRPGEGAIYHRFITQIVRKGTRPDWYRGHYLCETLYVGFGVWSVWKWIVLGGQSLTGNKMSKCLKPSGGIPRSDCRRSVAILKVFPSVLGLDYDHCRKFNPLLKSIPMILNYFLKSKTSKCLERLRVWVSERFKVLLQQVFPFPVTLCQRQTYSITSTWKQ